MRKLAILLLTVLVLSCEKQSDKTNPVNSKKTDNLIETNATPLVRNHTDSIKYSEGFKRTSNPEKEKKYSDDDIIDFSNIYSRLKKTKQHFVIKTNTDSTIIGSEGTIFSIKSNSFITQSGKLVYGKVDIYIKEFYTISDIIFNNLNTTCDDKLLETGGMILIEAFFEDEKCAIIKDKPILVAFPTSLKKNDMRLFFGDWNQEKINWTTIDAINTNSNEKEILNEVEVAEQPQFKGGEKALNQYLNKEITGALNTLSQSEDKKVTFWVQFVVSETGEVTNVRMMRGVEKTLDKVIYAAFLNMPNWIPAKQNSQPVSVQKITPIRLNLIQNRVKQTQENKNKEKDLIKEFEDIPIVYGGGEFSTSNPLFAKEFEEKVNDGNLSTISINELNHYVFSTSQLGWINCDRFIDDINRKTDLSFNLGNSVEKGDVKIIFNDINSIMTSTYENNKYTFANVPVGYDITIVAIKFENNQYYLSIKKTKTKEIQDTILDFKPVNMQSIKREIEKLNKS